MEHTSEENSEVGVSAAHGLWGRNELAANGGVEEGEGRRSAGRALTELINSFMAALEASSWLSKWVTRALKAEERSESTITMKTSNDTL